MSTRRQTELLLAFVCLALLAGLVHAGLAPYDFYLRNQVAWVQPAPGASAGGLRFDGHGIAATAGELPDPLGETGASVEVWLRRTSAADADGGVVLALGESDTVAPLVLAQWQDSLYFRFSKAAGAGDETLTLGDAIGERRSHFVAFVAAPRAGGTRVYVDAIPLPLPPSAAQGGIAPGALAGRLSLGSRIQATRGWTGRIEGVAIYRRALAAEEITAHASGGVADLSGTAGLVALFPLDERRGDRARDLAGGLGPLLVPTRYTPQDPGWLQPHPTLAGRPVTIEDAIVNFLGFVPVGLLAAIALSRVTGARNAALFVGALASGTVLSLAIESAQALLPSRVSAAVDLAMNAAGAGLGAAAGVVLVRWRKPWEARRLSS